jgi:hypothetical protein
MYSHLSREKAAPLVPAWKAADEVRFAELIRRLDHPQYHESKSARTPELRPEACRECRETNHGHAATRIGPFLICRCLQCPTLVIE